MGCGVALSAILSALFWSEKEIGLAVGLKKTKTHKMQQRTGVCVVPAKATRPAREGYAENRKKKKRKTAETERKDIDTN